MLREHARTHTLFSFKSRIEGLFGKFIQNEFAFGIKKKHEGVDVEIEKIDSRKN